MTLVLPLRTRSVANLREHWAARARRVKRERSLVAMLWPAPWRRRKWRFPLEVLLVRQAPSNGLDDDNLRSATKGVRDEIARQLGVDDRDARVRWEYSQARGPYSVLVYIEELGEAEKQPSLRARRRGP